MSAFVSGCPCLNDPPGFIRLKPLQILRRDLQPAKAKTTKLETGAGCPTFISIAQNVRTRRPKSGHCRRSSIVAGFIYNPLRLARNGLQIQIEDLDLQKTCNLMGVSRRSSAREPHGWGCESPL